MTLMLVPILVLAPGGMTPAEFRDLEPVPAVQREYVVPEPWASIAECESHGEWDYGPHSDWGSHLHEGGLQFAPQTWDAFRDPNHPEAAWQADPATQVEVAERVLAAQGWGAWPVCSRKVGLR